MRIHHWSTQLAPAHERFDYYASVLAEAVTPMAIRGAETAAFEAEVVSIGLGSISVLRMSGAPHEVLRGQHEVARSAERTFHLLINRRSGMRLAHRGTIHVPMGAAILVDSALGHLLELAEPYEVAHLRLPEAFIHRWLAHPAALLGKVLSCDAGWSAALCAAVRQLTPEFVSAAPLPAAVLEDQVGALLALATDAMRGSDREAPRKAEVQLCHRIEDCLRQLSSDPAITAETVARALDISTRTLHRALAKGGRTFGGLLMAQRVELAMRMLLTPSFRHLTTAEIGRRAGFSDASHFVRVFKRHTGQTPGDKRSL